MSRQVLAAAAMMCAAATAAESQILARHTPAPLADKITLSNVADCPTGPLEIAIYLAESSGELTVSGDADAEIQAGVQITVIDTGGDPVEVTAMEDTLFITVANFEPGHSIHLKVPLSSDLDEGEMQAVAAAGSLMAGAEAVVSAPNDDVWVGLFGQNGQATIDTPACLS